jgi:hypothetical protein
MRMVVFEIIGDIGLLSPAVTPLWMSTDPPPAVSPYALARRS